MRIGIDARILQGSLRGQGQYVHYLVNGLLKVAPDNEYVLFYNGLRNRRFFFAPGSNLKQVWSRFPGSVLRHAWSKCALPKVELFTGPVDVFHNTFNFCFTHYTPVPSRAPMVATFNGMTDPADIWEKCDLRPINRWFEIIASRAARIIAVSESVKQDLLERVPVSEEKIRVIYYGVGERFRYVADPEQLQPVLRRHDLAGKRYILYVGAADKNKNLDGLLEAFALLARRGSFADVFLVMVGPIDSRYRQLISRAAELGLERKVIFTGYIGHDDLPAVYGGAEIFTLPTFHEWFGIPLLESMACGTPVAASDCRGIPEVVGDAALLFDPKDINQIAEGFARLLTDQRLRGTLRDRGLARVKSFTWEKTAEQTLQVYREALSGGAVKSK